MQARIQLEPNVRIERAGCEVSVSNIRLEDGAIKHRVCLTRKGVPVACEVVARNSKFSVAELAERIRLGQVGPTTDTYRALVAMANIAEDIYGEVSE